MNIFADTANIDEIKSLVKIGIIDGVTTNPSLVSQVDISEEELHLHYKKICELVKGDVSVEVISTNADDIIKEALTLAAIDEYIVVKIPITEDGLTAIRYLARKNIRINCTLIFSVSQAILAAKTGAYYVSPFIGRLDDISEDGISLVKTIVDVFKKYNFGTKVLAASIRHPYHFVKCAEIGVDAITVPPSVLRNLIKHPLTNIGLERFLKDFSKVRKNVATN